MAFYKCGRIYTTSNSRVDIDTKSGSVARFNTSLAMPVLDCIAEFSATQDLNGQDKPYPAGGGKNKLPNKTYERNAQNVRLGVDNINARLIFGAGTYTLSLICPLTTSLYYSANGTNTNLNATTSNNKRVASFTLDEETELFFYAYNGSGLTSADVSEMQLELGSSASTYAPYENICPIVPVSSVNITRTGKNLLDKSAYGYVNVSNIVWGGGASGYANGSFVLPAGTYTFSVSVACNGLYATNSSGNIAVVYNKTSLTFTITETQPIRLQAYKTGVTQEDMLGFNYQLEFGNQATDYEAFQGTTALINLGGTYYGGSVDAVTGKIPLTHQFYNSLGSDISNVVKDSNSWRIYYSSAVYGTDNQYKEGLCDKLGFKTSYNRVNGNNNSIGFPSSTGTQILIRNDALTSAQEVKDFMATIEVVYPLATPIVVYASNTAEIPTKAGLNNIFCDTGDIEVKYRKLHSDN